MNTINNSANTQSELMLSGSSSQNKVCEYRKNPFDDIRCELPFFKNRCKSNPSQDNLQVIVEQFTSLLQSVFSVLDNTIQGLLGMIKNPAQEAPPAPGAPATPTSPAPATPTPTEISNGSSPVAPSEPQTKEKKEAEALNKSGEFLWKPASDKDGKLAILLPGNLTGRVKSVKVVDADGTVLGKGKYSGTGNPVNSGDREHYRFDKAGNKFPDGCFVEITLKNGNVKKVKIKETSERFTK